MQSGELVTPGEVLAGRYVIEELVGRGGFGEVWRAHDHRLERPVAIKLLHLQHRREDEALARFVLEARAAAAVSHSAIVVVHDIDTSLQSVRVPFIVMEYLEGRTLRQVLDDDGPFDLERATRLLVGALDGLGEAHAHGVVHKDLKPENIVVLDGGGTSERLKIVDFGIAHVRRAASSDPLGGATGFTGTAKYAAPEVILERLVTPAVDVYQMGLVLTEMLSGAPAVTGTTAIEMLMKHASGDLDVPQWLWDGPIGPVLRDALRLDATKRIGDGHTFAARLAGRSPVRGPAARVARKPTVLSDGAETTVFRPVAATADTIEIARPRTVNLFVGREDALGLLEQLLREERCITVLGPGGVGKSRLLREFLSTRPGGELPVSLSGVTDLEGFLARVAEELRIDQRTVDAIVDAINDQRIDLLVLDDIERLVDDIAPLVQELLPQCPRLRIVTTSRVALDIPEERRLPLGPLEEADAVRLLSDRIARRRGSPVQEAERAALSQIAQRLDRLPLGLELAAAHLAFSSATELFERIDAGLDSLHGQQGMNLRDVFEVSWGLLGQPERRLLARCSVFSRPFSMSWVRDVIVDGEQSPWQVADEFDRLVSKSVVSSRFESGTLRFSLLGTIREFAEEKLRTEFPDDFVAVAQRHARRWKAAAEAGDSDSRQRVDELLPVIRRVSKIDPGLAVELALASQRVFDSSRRFEAGIEAFQITLSVCDPYNTSDRASLLYYLSFLLWHAGRNDEAQRVQREMEGLVAESDAAGLALARAHAARGMTLLMQRDFPASRVQFERALEASVAAADQGNEPARAFAAVTRNNLAAATWTSGGLDRAMSLIEEAIAEHDDPVMRARFGIHKWFWRGLLEDPAVAVAELEDLRDELIRRADQRFAAFAEGRIAEILARRAVYGARDKIAAYLDRALEREAPKETAELRVLLAYASLRTNPTEADAICEVLERETDDEISRWMLDGERAVIVPLVRGVAAYFADKPEQASMWLGRARSEVDTRVEPNMLALIDTFEALSLRRRGAAAASDSLFARALQTSSIRPVEPLPALIDALAHGRGFQLPPYPALVRERAATEQRMQILNWIDFVRFLS